MKRRVLTSKANKRALRVIQATTNVKAPFHVLVDASFMRMAAEGKTTNMTETLKEVFGGYTYIYFHPATKQALMESSEVGNQLLENTEAVCVRTPGSELEAEAKRSEVDAIKQQVQILLTKGAPDGRKVSCLFVASVSHTIRTAVKGQCPLIRVTAKPTSFWLEPMEGGAAVTPMPKDTVVEEAREEADEDQGESTGAEGKAQRSSKRARGESSDDKPAVAVGSSSCVTVKATDRAFLKHKLGITLPDDGSTRQGTGGPQGESRPSSFPHHRGAKQSLKATAGKGGHGAKNPPPLSREERKKAALAKANPLARKKPQKKERFVSD